MDVISGTTYKSLARKTPLTNQQSLRQNQDVFNRLYECKTPINKQTSVKQSKTTVKKSSRDSEGEKARRDQIPEKKDKDGLARISPSRTSSIENKSEMKNDNCVTETHSFVNDINFPNNPNVVRTLLPEQTEQHCNDEDTVIDENQSPVNTPKMSYNELSNEDSLDDQEPMLKSSSSQCNTQVDNPTTDLAAQPAHSLLESKKLQNNNQGEIRMLAITGTSITVNPAEASQTQSSEALPKLAGKYGREIAKTLLSVIPRSPDADKDTCDNDKEHEDPQFYDVRVKTRHVKYENSTLSILNTSSSGDTTPPPEKPPLKTSVRKSLGNWMTKSKVLLDGVYQNLPSYMSYPQNMMIKPAESNHQEIQLPSNSPSILPNPIEETMLEEELNPISSFSFLFPECVCCIDGVQKCKCSLITSETADLEDLIDTEQARMWWTITGNFGNILPIDWSKTYTRQKYLPALNLNERQKAGNRNLSGPPSTNASPRTSDEEDQVAQDLDMHQLILSDAPREPEPIKSADEVIQEIDDIMQEGSSSEDEGIEDGSSSTKASEASLTSLPPPLYHDKLKDLNTTQLNEVLMELEMTIRQYSETLINQLALRDELEYEKELKNTFISLLLQVQNKRRIFNVEKKKPKKSLGGSGPDPKYLTTVIPYDIRHKTPDNQTVQILIKILKAINDDSPTVPTLLTDYILKVLCPS